MKTLRRITAGAAATVVAATLGAAAAAPASASAMDLDTCDLSSKVDELRAWDTNDQYNIIVWKESSYGSSNLSGVVVSGSTSATACGFTNEIGTYSWAVFESGEFFLDGDGGYRNWAFFGVFDRPEDNHVVFHDF